MQQATSPQQQQQQQPQQTQPQQQSAQMQQLASQARAVAERVVAEFGQYFAWDEASARANKIKYYISRVIGQGASATVFHIRRTEDNASFALKFVDLSTMPEADKQRARAELDCLVSCDIFTVVRCHEEFCTFHPLPGTINQDDYDNPRLFALVLDHANAGDLRMEIKNRARANRPFREHEAGLLFLQVLLAVHHVHSKHMIHRDIKSANVLLCTNGLLKLGDFGFSRIYHNATVSDNVGKTFCGTPYYVAPEIWRRKPYSKKADIFSIGVLLYELLTLRRPFDGATVQDVMEKTLTARPDPLPESISPEMRQLVQMLLADNPDDRPTTAQLLRLPISKLFLDALIGIVLTQNTFDSPLRDEIREHIRIVRDSLSTKARLMERLSLAGQTAASPASASVISQSAQDISGIFLEQDDILCEGILRKLSVDGSWKRRYLAIVHRKGTNDATKSPAKNIINNDNENDNPRGCSTGGSNGGGANGSVAVSAMALRASPPRDAPDQYDLILAVTKEGAAQQCIATNFSELEDVFPVPFKYAGPGMENVFAIAFKSGVKRLTFQAASSAEQDAWRMAIQTVLGLDTDE